MLTIKNRSFFRKRIPVQRYHKVEEVPVQEVKKVLKEEPLENEAIIAPKKGRKAKINNDIINETSNE